jgi:hypothetical protein
MYVNNGFARILCGYLNNKDINTALFSWAMPKPWMFDIISGHQKRQPVNPLKSWRLHLF